MTPSSWIAWLRHLSWPALRQQWGRQTLALLAIALGVALATAVQLINSAGLREFDAAARALSGQADLELSAATGALDEALFARLAEREDVLALGPMLEGRAQLLDAQGQPFSLRLLGVDMLQLAQLQPELLPLFDGETPPDLLADGQLFLNPAALQRLGPKPPAELSLRLQLQGQPRSVTLRLAGRTGTPGAPLAVLDIAVAQALLGRPGELDRIAMRLLPGLDPQAVAAGLALPPGVRARSAAAAEGQAAQLSQAYRVNLGVLSLMALFVGGFLVFAVHTLSVAQRLPQLALLGVLGMSARERAGLVLAEALLLGLLGSLLGLALGIGLAALGLELLGGDLGAGMLAGMSGGVRPQLQLPFLPLLALGGLGLAVSPAAAALPVWGLRRLPAAQVLKGLGADSHPRLPRWLGPGLLLLGGLLSLTPPLQGLPLGAYAAMLCLLFGGLAAVPALVDGLRRLLPRRRSALALLIRERAHDQAGEATRMLAGVLVALSLSVAMLVMVGSFRASLDAWLRDMLPADLFVRNGLRAARQEGLPLPPDFVQRLRASGIAERIAQQRTRELSVAGQPVLMLARELPDDEGRLPLTGALAAPRGQMPKIYVNEAMRDQLRLHPGDTPSLELAGRAPLPVLVRGVWRDYSRQSPALLIALADYRRWSGDAAATDLMLYLPPGTADMQALQQRLRALAERPEDIELAAAGELRRFSLQLFDRSFAVTYWLQAVALGVGLFGVAASLSAQVLARRREFGLLLHLGFERRTLRRMVVAEALLFGAAGAIAGLLLGLAISAVLVWVLNPQSFHWSMDMHVPLARLALLMLAVLLASGLTAWWAARAAAGPDALQSVKEDW
ncbi:ABC transporter permease [Paucibacter soli]|uniref:ABC transporter permease n=1 Tax=Paucibacter soli TaxID=3133433 RepID=UPI0030989FF3